MGIGSTVEIVPGPLPQGLQIAAPKTETVLALAPPAMPVHPPDDQGDVDELSAGIKSGLPKIIQDPD